MDSKCCRMCASPVKTYISVFGNYENRRPLVTILENFTSIKVIKDDGLPTVICLQCLSTLENCEKMRKEAIQAQTKFPNYKESEIEIQNMDMKSQIVLTPIKTKTKQVQINPALQVSSSSLVNKSNLQSDVKMKCRVCHKSFSNSMQRLHICISHDLKCNACNAKLMCKCKSTNPTPKKARVKKVSRTPAISCHHCTECFEKAEYLVDHLKDIAKQKIYSCNYCPRFFCDPVEYNEHTENNHINV